MYTEDTAQKVLIDPFYTGGNRLCIISAHATPGMASWLLTNYDERSIPQISVELIVGMTADEGIPLAFHEGFKLLHGNNYAGRDYHFSCSYISRQPSIHDNLYIWMNGEEPLCAFSGSLEFTQASFLQHQEQIYECSAVDAFQIYNRAVDRSVYCNYAEIEEEVRIFGSYQASNTERTADGRTNQVSLSWLTRKGNETGTRSGPNWGHRGRRNRNEAYIPLPSAVAKSGFFPLNKQHFIALTDDHRALLLRVEQMNDKAITTPASNAQLGEYLRNRMGLPNGAYIHKADFETYGRTDVTFYKIDDEQYYMDFSVVTPTQIS